MMVSIHNCIHLDGNNWTAEELHFLSEMHQNKRCLPVPLWLDKIPDDEESGPKYSYIHEHYPDESDAKYAKSLQEVCERIWK